MFVIVARSVRTTKNSYPPRVLMMEKLRILMLAPLWRPIKKGVTAARPQLIYELATRLTKRGHQVAILGTGDSYIKGVEIIPVVLKGLALMEEAVENPFYRHLAFLTLMLKTLGEKASRFDLIHNHMYPEFLPFLVEEQLSIPMVTTIHAQVTPEMRGVFKKFSKSHLVAISQSAKRLAGNLANIKVIYNGVDASFFKPIENKRSGDYLFFIGRMSLAKDKKGNYLDPKGATIAIDVAEKAGERLLLTGNVQEKGFYDELIAPHLSEKIKFVGPVSQEQALSRERVRSLMQNAKALLFPVCWEEPFGLVQVEAMACGTPVIAFNRGSISEIVRDGVTGFIIEPDVAAEVGHENFCGPLLTREKSDNVHHLSGARSEATSKNFMASPPPVKRNWQIQKSGVEGLVEAIKRIGEIDRKKCRQHVEKNFTLEKMVDHYENFYFQLLKG